MSEFLAEALVVVRPDTKAFRAQLVAQLAVATKGIVVPVTVAPVAASGVTSLAGATTGLAASQQVLTQTSTQVAGAQRAVATATTQSTAALLGAASATARLDAALLGLRTALGSTAVIGLGALALAAIVAGKALSASIRNFASFQQELSSFRVIAGATAEQMKAVSDQASRLGADVRLPAVSAADAAVAMTELAKAGLSVEDAMAGAEGVLQLATAAQISNAEASKIAANALNSFGLAGDQAARVADNLANAANAAQGSISDFGFAFAQASAVARQVGLSLEDTTSILALFARNGLQGSDAGTSLRVALIRLVAPTKKAAAEIQKLGLDIRDAQGNVRADVFAQFGEATRELSPAMRDASAALIFGQDAIRAVAIGAREGTDGLRLMQFQIDQQGTAAEVAAARTEGLAGAFSSLESSAQTLSIVLGKLGAGPLQSIAEGFAAIAATSAAAISGIQRVESALDDFLESLPGGKETNEFIDFFASPGKAFGETAKIINQLIKGSDESSKKIAKLNEELQALQTARIAAQESGDRGAADQLTKEIEALRDEIKALEDAGKGIDTGVTAPLKRAIAEAEKAKDIRLSIDVNADTTDLDRLIARFKQQLPVAEAVQDSMNRLTDESERLNSSFTFAASGADVLTAALKRLRSESAGLSDQLQKAQAEGATPQTQIAILEQQNAKQRQIIANAEKGGRQSGDISVIRKARAEIIANNAEIKGLQNEITSSTKALATAAEKAQDERQKAFERILAAQLRPKERLLIRAAATEGLGDDIKFREVIIKILQGQIALIRKTLGNTQEARELIKSIQDRILSEVNKLKEDQRNFRRQLRDALEERLERAQRGTELDIELADINENTKRRITLRERLIQQLLKERKKLKLTGNALKENRNEIARIRAEIEAIAKEEGEAGKSAQKRAAEFLFSQLQAQQGFASNLLGNLITGPTAGLVGVPAPPSPGQGVSAAARQAEGRAQTAPTSGQANTELSLLEKILIQLRILNGSYDAPEAINQKKSSGGSMDYAAM